MKIVNIGIIIHPSTRASAYLNSFEQLNILPQEIIIMKKYYAPSVNLKREDKKYKYSRDYFPLNYNYKKLASYPGVKVYKVNSDNINSTILINTLKKCINKNFIFSGGGILQKEVLSLNKKFIHIHPGSVPEFRGSTCFYYSILNKNKLGCSAFYMNNMIDHGNVIDIFNFKFNLQILKDQTLFLDYIFDPFVRSLALKKILTYITKGKKIPNIAQKCKKSLQPYFIAHPLIRLFCIKKIKKNFSEKKNYINII